MSNTEVNKKMISNVIHTVSNSKTLKNMRWSNLKPVPDGPNLHDSDRVIIVESIRTPISK